MAGTSSWLQESGRNVIQAALLNCDRRRQRKSATGINLSAERRRLAPLETESTSIEKKVTLSGTLGARKRVAKVFALPSAWE
jgi:hypothetical protein